MVKRLTAAVLCAAATSLSGCSFSLEWIEGLRAQRAVARHDFVTAADAFGRLVDRAPDGPRAVQYARQGARIAHLETKNYPQAIDFYRTLILRAPDPIERKTAQRYVAQIYFDNLLDYDQAVVEFEKLLKLEHRPEEAFRYRLNLAKSHFQLNNLDQAGHELDVILDQSHSGDEAFEAKSMKANILVAQKRTPEAAQAWDQLLHEYPERAKKENVALNLVVCYEEMKDFGRAIEALERMKADYANPEFLNKRIERLAKRQSNLPGAQGWKR